MGRDGDGQTCRPFADVFHLHLDRGLKLLARFCRLLQACSVLGARPHSIKTERSPALGALGGLGGGATQAAQDRSPRNKLLRAGAVPTIVPSFENLVPSKLSCRRLGRFGYDPFGARVVMSSININDRPMCPVCKHRMALARIFPANAASSCGHSSAPPADGPNKSRCRWIP